MDLATKHARDALSRKRILDPLDVDIARLKGLSGHLSVRDRELLFKAAELPLDVEKIRLGRDRDVQPDAYQLLWLVHHKLLEVWVDPRDRVWVRTTRLGLTVAREVA